MRKFPPIRHIAISTDNQDIRWEFRAPVVSYNALKLSLLLTSRFLQFFFRMFCHVYVVFLGDSLSSQNISTVLPTLRQECRFVPLFDQSAAILER